MTLLALSNLWAGYGPVPVLKGVSLEVRTGEIVALIGANGAGKTTTLMTLSGVVPARAGGITFRGDAIEAWPPHRIAQAGIRQVPEGRRIFPRLSVLENLQVGAYAQIDAKRTRATLEELFSLFPILAERRTQAGGTLSGGEQQMLAIGRALMSSPTLLLLDEPSLGLSPVMAERIFEMIRTIQKQGTTILLVEQNARAALGLADRGYVMEMGEVTLTDSAARLAENPQVQAAYLGGG